VREQFFDAPLIPRFCYSAKIRLRDFERGGLSTDAAIRASVAFYGEGFFQRFGDVGRDEIRNIAAVTCDLFDEV